MKKNIYNLIIILSLIIILFQILTNKTLISDTITYSLNMWTTTIIPSLFPFFIISELLLSLNITSYIPKPIKKLFKFLFNVNDNAISIFFLSLVSGFPSNARNTRILYNQNKLTIEEASHILTFTHFSNPLFILTTLALFFLKNEQLGYIILISHYLGNIIIGILLRNHSTYTNNTDTKKDAPCQKFASLLIRSIKSSIDTILLIGGTLTCFLILSALLINTLDLSSYNSMLLKGLLEITMGLKSLSLLNLSDLYKTVLSTIFISFGGLSVHIQVLSQISDTKIKYTPFLIARIYHAIISGFISYLLYSIIF